MEEMLRRDAPFVVATVIRVRGSAVARPGAKSIIDDEGRAVFGWVGGGCVESFVCAEAKEALAAGCPRIITADLEDELSGVGLPCGGVMEIFIEPVMPRRRVLILGGNEVALHASELAERIGFAVSSFRAAGIELTAQDSALETLELERGSLIIIANPGENSYNLEPLLKAEPEYMAVIPPLLDGQAQAGLDLGGTSPAEMALSVAAEMLAVTRNASARPLQETKMDEPVSRFEPVRERVAEPSLVIVGHSSITEELAWMAARLNWRVFVDGAGAIEENYPAGVGIILDDADFGRMPASPDTAVVVATHHKGDHLAIERALAAGAWYVGLIASAHRSRLVRAMLEDSLQRDARLKILRTPSGLDLGAATPAEIALSIMSEVLACFHGRAGGPRLPAPASRAMDKGAH
jgi:xanthine dehydrogenase accessory factor